MILFRVLTTSARSATAFDHAFTSCHGSRLFTLRLHFAHGPAVPFSTSPAMRKVNGSCRDLVSFADRALLLFHLSVSFIGRRFIPETSARVTRPCWCAVTTFCPLGHCDSPRLETCLDYFIQLTAVSYRGLLRVSSVAYGTCDRARRTGESCLLLRNRSSVSRDRTNQPDPIFPRSPGIIFESQLMQTFVFTNRQLVLSMNCEHHSKNSESVKKLICTRLFTSRNKAAFTWINAHAHATHVSEVIHSAKPLQKCPRE